MCGKDPDLPSASPVLSGKSHRWMIKIQMIWRKQRAMTYRFSPHTDWGVPGGAGVRSISSHQHTLAVFQVERVKVQTSLSQLLFVSHLFASLFYNLAPP